MKLQEVPTEILTESLLALADLRRKYRGEPMVTAYAGNIDAKYSNEQCPLCVFQLKAFEQPPSRHCECLWFWVEGHGCEAFPDESGVETFDEIPIPDRLARIDRWEATITEELAARAKGQ